MTRVAPVTRLDIHLGDNLPILACMPDSSFDLIYVDPPFNTGVVQARKRTRTIRDDSASRIGFGGQSYRSETLGQSAWDDRHDDFVGWLMARMKEAHRLLAPDGSLFVHLD